MDACSTLPTGISVVLGGHFLYFAFLALGTYALLCRQEKMNLESKLAGASKIELENEADIKARNGQNLRLTNEIEELQAKAAILHRRNEELEGRVVEGEDGLRRREFELESMVSKERTANELVVSLSRAMADAMADQVVQIADLKSKLQAMEAECSSWAHQIHLLIQEKEEVEERSQKRQMKVLELQEKLTECYARLNERFGLSKSPFMLWGPPLVTTYDRGTDSSRSSLEMSPSYSAPAASPLNDAT